MAKNIQMIGFLDKVLQLWLVIGSSGANGRAQKSNLKSSSRTISKVQETSAKRQEGAQKV